MANPSFPPAWENTVDNKLDLRVDESQGGPQSGELGEAQPSPILVLSRYSALIETVRKAAPRGVPVVRAPDVEQAIAKMRSLRPGVLVIDTASTADMAAMVAQLSAEFPALVIIAAGQRDDGAGLAQLTASGQIFRFLLVPLSHGQTRLTLDAAIAVHRNLTAAPPRIEEHRAESAKKRDFTGYAAFALGLALSIWGIWWFALRSPSEPEAPVATAAPTIAPPTSPVASQPEPLQAELALAQEALARGEYIEPVGKSALDYYRSALNIDPQSIPAREGLRRVASNVLERAAAALSAQKIEDAVAAIEIARDIDPQHPGLAVLDALVASERSKPAPVQDVGSRIAALADQARERTNQGRLVAPKGSSALDALLEARRLDPSSTEVAQGSRQLSQALVEEAERMIKAGNLEEARTLATSARLLGSDATLLSAVDTALNDARNNAAANRQPRPPPRATTPVPATAAIPTPTPAPAPTNGALTTPRNPDPARAQSNEPMPAVKVPESAPTPPILAREAAAPGADPATRPAEPTEARTSATGGANTIVPASTLRRTRTVEPEYPIAARRRKETGMVEVVFTVTPDGSVENVEVRKSMPELVFDEAAKKAVEQWRFEPVKVDGQPISQRASARLRFSMD